MNNHLPPGPVALPCPHCGARPNQQCGYILRKHGWQTLILRRYHHSREEAAGVDHGPSDWRLRNPFL